MAGKVFRMRAALAGMGAGALALIAGCDNGPSAVATRQQAAGAQMAYETPLRAERSGGERQDARSEPVRRLDGAPLWAASRRYSAEQSAERAYDRNGAAFGAKDLDDYVRKAHAFVGRPPKGVETIKRANGDTLFYDAKTNVFAVADPAGAPRTMFKPDDGAAYWQAQKDRESRRTTARSERRDRPADDEA